MTEAEKTDTPPPPDEHRLPSTREWERELAALYFKMREGRIEVKRGTGLIYAVNTLLAAARGREDRAFEAQVFEAWQRAHDLPMPSNVLQNVTPAISENVVVDSGAKESEQ